MNATVTESSITNFMVTQEKLKLYYIPPNSEANNGYLNNLRIIGEGGEPRFLSIHKSGKIINISSIVGAMGNLGQVNYVSAKAGVIGMTKACALEMAPRGINVNCVAPGFIETDMTDGLSEGIKKWMLERISLAKFGQTEDIVNAVTFLASNEAAYITGQTIYVNGGMYNGQYP